MYKAKGPPITARYKSVITNLKKDVDEQSCQDAKSMAQLAHLLKENSTSTFFMEINYNYLICYVIILTAERLVVCFVLFLLCQIFNDLGFFRSRITILVGNCVFNYQTLEKAHNWPQPIISSDLVSCRTVAPREIRVDGPCYIFIHKKNCMFIAHKKVRTVSDLLN